MNFQLLPLTQRTRLINALQLTLENIEHATTLDELRSYQRGVRLVNDVLTGTLHIGLAETQANDWWNEDESAIASTFMHLFQDIICSELRKTY